MQKATFVSMTFINVIKMRPERRRTGGPRHTSPSRFLTKKLSDRQESYLIGKFLTKKSSVRQVPDQKSYLIDKLLTKIMARFRVKPPSTYLHTYISMCQTSFDSI
jgi:hypothetical protein